MFTAFHSYKSMYLKAFEKEECENHDVNKRRLAFTCRSRYHCMVLMYLLNSVDAFLVDFVKRTRTYRLNQWIMSTSELFSHHLIRNPQASQGIKESQRACLDQMTNVPARLVQRKSTSRTIVPQTLSSAHQCYVFNGLCLWAALNLSRISTTCAFMHMYVVLLSGILQYTYIYIYIILYYRPCLLPSRQENQEEVEHVSSSNFDSASDQVHSRMHFHILNESLGGLQLLSAAVSCCLGFRYGSVAPPTWAFVWQRESSPWQLNYPLRGLRGTWRQAHTQRFSSSPAVAFQKALCWTRMDKACWYPTSSLLFGPLRSLVLSGSSTYGRKQ